MHVSGAEGDGRGPEISGKQVSTVAATLALVTATALALVVAPEPPSRSLDSQVGPVSSGLAHDDFDEVLFHLPSDSMAGFVHIPAGAFLMGSDPALDRLAFEVERWSANEAQGHVEVDQYYLGRTEVTIAQYAAFTTSARHQPIHPAALDGPQNHPVTHVSWPDAVAYTRWLDGALRSSPDTPPAVAALLRSGWTIELPNEAQWEKGARGPNGAVWPWGNDFRDDAAHFGSPAPVPVGTFECLACAWGLQDMAGNVWEWTRSPYLPYPFGGTPTATTPATSQEDALWVIRGGGFGDSPQHIRGANRGGADPGARRPFIGFRIALVRGGDASAPR